MFAIIRANVAAAFRTTAARGREKRLRAAVARAGRELSNRLDDEGGVPRRDEQGGFVGEDVVLAGGRRGARQAFEERDAFGGGRRHQLVRFSRARRPNEIRPLEAKRPCARHTHTRVGNQGGRPRASVLCAGRRVRERGAV